MEILAHTLWTTAGVRKLNIESEKNGKPNNISIFWSAFWGIFPDLFAFTIPFLAAFSQVIFNGQKFISFDAQHKIADSLGLSYILYQYSHSLILFLLVFIVIWVIRRKPPLAMLGWALHILIDIPSHSINFFPTPFLFPISNYRFPYGVTWSNTWFMLFNYTALAIVWGSILFEKYHISKQKVL